MNKPNNFENTQVGGDFIPVELGGHYATIIGVNERSTKNGDPMIVVALDFDKKDAQEGYFKKAFDADTRDDKKWPNQATNYITTEYRGDCTRGFKSFLKAFAESNGLSVEKDIKWGNDFCSQFKKKKIGVVFGEEEQFYNGETKTRRVIRWFCDYNKVSEQKVPDMKPLKNDIPSVNIGNSNAFVNVPDGADEEIPF